MSQLPIGSDFGNFQIVRHIGGGGMAQIYLAKTSGLAGFEKFLALKVINPEYANEERFVQMLIDEAKITVGLSHVNIGQIFDLGQIDDIFFIAMEFVDGIDVLELVNGFYSQGQQVPVEAVAFVGRQMSNGLHYAHTRKDKAGKPLNLIHRDISPQNILVSRAGEVKIVDFGIAKAAGMSTKTHAGVIKGKVHYMAPEQAMGKKIDHRIDIFSTGIVMWEMLTSQMVYSGDNVRILLDKVRIAKIPAPSTIRKEVPPALDEIVMKALARKVEDRYQTALELQIELTKFISAAASDFSGANLAALVEQVISQKDRAIDNIDSHAAKEDLIKDVHSVIREDGLDDSTDLKLRPRLIVDNDGKEAVYSLEEEMVIGRAGTLAIPDARVSRRHARIIRKDKQYVVEDMGSSNGTFLNDEKVIGQVVLKSNDEIRVGSCKMRFFTPEEKKPVTADEPEAPKPLVGKLVITRGGKRVEHTLAESHDLSYSAQLGPMALSGTSGQIIRKEDGFWVEPGKGRQELKINGKASAEPTRLTSGDSLSVGAAIFEYLES